MTATEEQQRLEASRQVTEIVVAMYGAAPPDVKAVAQAWQELYDMVLKNLRG